MAFEASWPVAAMYSSMASRRTTHCCPIQLPLPATSAAPQPLGLLLLGQVGPVACWAHATSEQQPLPTTATAPAPLGLLLLGPVCLVALGAHVTSEPIGGHLIAAVARCSGLPAGDNGKVELRD